jgi:hypothetical protein
MIIGGCTRLGGGDCASAKILNDDHVAASKQTRKLCRLIAPLIKAGCRRAARR